MQPLVFKMKVFDIQHELLGVPLLKRGVFMELMAPKPFVDTKDRRRGVASVLSTYASR